MVLVTHQLQGSYVAFPSNPLSWSKGLALRRHVVTLKILSRREKGISLKRNVCLSTGAPQTYGLKAKNIRISAFKGSARNDESVGRANDASVPKNSVKVSYVPKDGEEAVIEPSKAHNGPLAYASQTTETIVGSPAIKLFKKWIMILRSQSPSQVMDQALGEGPPPRDTSEAQIETQINRQSDFLKIIGSHFWSMDATIKVPLLMFVPWFLAVSVIYGAEVSKELTPLWVFGPLIVALYIKMLRGLCALYVFTFKHTVKIIRNLPTYYLLAYNYIARGKLKEDVRARVWQPVVDIKNLDYKELSRRKMKDFQEWLTERNLDFVESIWPYYCRTIRFLKRANLI
ncbi:hypothetical protein COLO4_30099 [Corchorus olitorius]|uniref:Uncharacterized protein n=1 Tax=Corchorus olitorius TaxID=93759 RepID=A0A1R3HB39_9ROSI|nr:hypothetical protein COLO4_30099 [Corchorus olitorius]